MADFDATVALGGPFDPSAVLYERDVPGSVDVALGGACVGALVYFKMRALADPGPGYETWVVVGSADFTGTGAGGPIQAGTAVVVAQWEG